MKLDDRTANVAGIDFTPPFSNRIHPNFILGPPFRGLVPFKTQFSGRALHESRFVQVLVLSDDQRWYLQPDPVWNGDYYTVDATFGFEDSRHGFFVIAVGGDEKIVTSPVTSIPAASVLSNIVFVERIS